MTAGLAIVALLSLQMPQESPAMFAARAGVGPGASRRVAADRRSVDCLHALEELTAAVGWNLHVDSEPLANDLRFQRIDLNFADLDPRIVAQLIAVAAGADCILDEAAPVEGARPTLHVVRSPSPETESGRQRLRALAGQWYRSFLHDELRHDPRTQTESVDVRMNLGQLLLENGDLDAAITFFTEAYEKQPHDHVAAAMLKIAECHLDLARATTDSTVREQQYTKGEEWARKLLERAPNAPEVAETVVVLGRLLLGRAATTTDRAAGRELARQCEAELRARLLRLGDFVTTLDVWLLLGQAQFETEQADRVWETMLTIRESPRFRELSRAQLRDYHFLLGYGALGLEKHEIAVRSLEWFVANADADNRRGIAYVLLAESELGRQRFVQARAASVEARARHIGAMSAEWRQRTLQTWARTALALGEKDSAFHELEQIVQRDGGPELTMFLVDELLADQQWQRAISLVRPLAEAPAEGHGEVHGDLGDRARFKLVTALFEQALASKNLEDFPRQAIVLAPRIHDPDLRSRTATMIGDAYSRLGRLEHAADAYRGILR